MAATAAKAAPVNVSPFIKTCRYGLLIFGIFTGKAKWHRYHQIQENRRAAYEKLRPTIEAQKYKREVDLESDGVMQLGQILEIQFPEGWKSR